MTPDEFSRGITKLLLKKDLEIVELNEEIERLKAIPDDPNVYRFHNNNYRKSIAY